MERVITDQQKLRRVLSLIKDNLDSLANCSEALMDLGIDVNHIEFASSGNFLYGTPHSVLLTNGIGKLSILTEEKIDGKDSNFRHLKLNGIMFIQPKLPVDCEDRYA